MRTELEGDSGARPVVPTGVFDKEDVAGATPRYLQLARGLQELIQAGHYAIGSLLPTEVALATLHRVSRQTVRQAIGELRKQGLLSARRGVGTRVEARQPSQRVSYSMMSASDLIEIAKGTEMTVDRRRWIEARGGLAAELGCRPNHRWLQLDCTRQSLGNPRPFAAVRVYIDGRVAPTLSIPDHLYAALFVMIETQCGEVLTEIQQAIRATTLDRALAAQLDAVEGAPALEITRRYFSSGRRLVLVSVNTLPSDRFLYSVTITRD